MKEEIIKNLNVNEKQADLIIKLYETAKQIDSSVEMQFRPKDFVGVGRHDELLKFYLSSGKKGVTIKFKHLPKSLPFDLNNENLYLNEIKNVEEYFKDNDMLQSSNPKARPDYQIFNKSRFDVVCDLANGFDPITGECIFTPSKDFHTLIMNIALFVLQKDKSQDSSFKVYRKYLEKINKLLSERAMNNNDEKTKKVWTEQEVKVLLKQSESMSLEEMAKEHRCSVSSVKTQLKNAKSKN